MSDGVVYYGGPVSPGLSVLHPKGNEWRTPPLWGLHDSAPYLHDGRAHANVRPMPSRLHRGEAQLSAMRYKRLDREARRHMDMFLASLTAPPLAEADRKTKKR